MTFSGLFLMSMCTLVLLALAPLTADCRVQSKVKVIPRHAEHRDHTLDLLPNVEDHAVMKKLRCSSCLQLTKKLWLKFQDIYAKSSTTPRQAVKVGYGGGIKGVIHSQLVGVIDNLCTELDNKYGLVIRDGETTTEVSDDDDRSGELLKGIWLNGFMKKRCSHMMIHHEDRIIEKHPEADTLDHFSKLMCMEWDGSCELGDLANKGLKVSASQSLRAEEL
jgi:hypothetical protein